MRLRDLVLILVLAAVLMLTPAALADDVEVEPYPEALRISAREAQR